MPAFILPIQACSMGCFRPNLLPKQVADDHHGAAPAPAACPGTRDVEKGIKTALQCALQALFQTASIWFRDRYLRIVFSLCTYASSPTPAANEK